MPSQSATSPRSLTRTHDNDERCDRAFSERAREHNRPYSGRDRCGRRHQRFTAAIREQEQRRRNDQTDDRDDVAAVGVLRDAAVADDDERRNEWRKARLQTTKNRNHRGTNTENAQNDTCCFHREIRPLTREPDEERQFSDDRSDR
ncbi:MAG: hypothetical protein EB145_11070 [Proteobacteria bacterium]|nr:hypothetical protein [Pseudomonadota bacterium]